ncbi:MAG TPA: hypothetical protein PK858_10095, partial [Saprospiraceae bacterium]|nr:hypothetical protein [Saprospiraceae bacterium]
IQDELRGLAPWLHDLRQPAPEDGFQVPEGYFESLEHRVLARIEQKGPGTLPALTARRGGGWLTARRMWAAAAATVALASAFWLLRPAPAAQDALALTDEEVEAYVVDNLHEFEMEQLAALSDAADSPDTPLSTPDARPAAPAAEEDFSPEDVDKLLQDMSEEELEEIL